MIFLFHQSPWILDRRPPRWPWTVFRKDSLPKDASSLFSKPTRKLQFLNRLLAFGIFLFISAHVFRSVSDSAHSTVEKAQPFTMSIFPVSDFGTVVYTFRYVRDAPYCTSDAWKMLFLLVLLYFLPYEYTEAPWLKFPELHRRQCNCTASFRRFLFRLAMKSFWMSEYLHKAVFLSAIKSRIFSASTISLPNFNGVLLPSSRIPSFPAYGRRYIQTVFL